MSDDYGKISINLPPNFKADVGELRYTLNRFGWSNDHEQWDIDYQDHPFCHSSFNRTLQYPTAFPYYRYAIDVMDDDLTIRRINSPSGPEIVQAIEDGDDIFSEECDLDLITRIFAPTIKEGWIEIFSISSSKDGSFRAITLIIDASYNSKVTIFSSGYGCEKSSTEEYVYQWSTPSLEELELGDTGK